MPENQKPTCSDYRQEMMLLGLKNRLAHGDLSDAERQTLEAEIRKLEDKLLGC